MASSPAEKYCMNYVVRLSCGGLLAMLIVASSSCKNKDKVSDFTDSSSGGGSTPVTPPVVSTAVPLKLKMSTQYDHTEYINSLTFVETGTDECTVTSATSPVTCTVNVPEGRLYFSSLLFTFAWLPSTCTLLTFEPYFYLANNTGSYTPPGADAAVDCSLRPISASCYGGAAVDIVPSFPKYTGLIYEPDETNLAVANDDTLTVNSAHSHGYGSNRWTVNDMPLASVGNSATAADLNPTGSVPGDTYVGGTLGVTYQNYQFSCRDHWYDPESLVINVNVVDVDSSVNPQVDDFFSWKEW